MTLNLVLTGGSGRVGTAVRVLAPPHDVLDVCDPRSIKQYLDAMRPTAILHAAALVGVTACAADPEGAHRVNVLGTRHLADACAERNIRLVVVSTDYVFAGDDGGYREDSPVGPRTAYGRSKAAAEREALERHSDVLVVRTSFHPDGRWGIPSRSLIR